MSFLRVCSLAPLAFLALLAGPVVASCGGSGDAADGIAPDGGGAAGASGSGGDAGGGGSAGAGGTAGTGGGDASTTSDTGASDAAIDVAADVPIDPPVGAWPPPTLKLTSVATNLSQPVFATSPAGDVHRLFIVEKAGKIQLYIDGAKQAKPFLDVTSVVITPAGSEQGLLGLAFHPSYAQNGRFFVHYSDRPNGNTYVAEYARSGTDPNLASTTRVKTLVTQQQPFTNHNGGMLAFGPDGKLYLGLGDGGSAGDPNKNGQNKNVKLGKILRLDVDTYPTPPAGNLTGGEPAIWDYGMRNPWRFSFDRLTGDLYIGDVGQDTYEEIDVEPAGQGSKNYGWNTMEGMHCYKAATCDQTGLTLPVTEYTHAAGDCSITGGYVYRGKAIPGLVGTYLYSDYCSKKVRALQWKGGTLLNQGDITASIDPTKKLSAVSSFGEDANGEMYIVSLDGNVFRIDAN